MKLTFLGAAQNVTGSRYLLECGSLRLLMDCGLFQERDLRGRNWDPFPVPPETVDAVLLTHAHLDHCGFLPKLVHDGFRGPVYCTKATADILRIMLADSAKIQEEDADFKRRRHKREGRQGPFPEIPLYTTEDAEACFSLLSPVQYGENVAIDRHTTSTFHDAGHVLGSSVVSIAAARNGEQRTLLFSGDIGRWNRPIVRDPTVFSEADYVLVESTYGDREHEDMDTVSSQLAEILNTALQAGGNIIVPSFALERSQEVLYLLNELLMQGRIPPVMVFLDSPMAVRITEVFRRHPEHFDTEMQELMEQGNSPFDFPGLTMVRSKGQSKAVNSVRGSAVIIAGSGMCTGGRIKHHLTRNISRPESTILFVGYQAEGTLGRYIVDGATEVRILGEQYPVRARIAQIEGLSAHADRDELFRWLSGLNRAPKRVFVVHGEAEAAAVFAESIREQTAWNVSVPAYLEETFLD